MLCKTLPKFPSFDSVVGERHGNFTAGVAGLALHGDASTSMSHRGSCSQITCCHSSALNSAERFSESSKGLQRGSDKLGHAPSPETLLSRDPVLAHSASSRSKGMRGAPCGAQLWFCGNASAAARSLKPSQSVPRLVLW